MTDGAVDRDLEDMAGGRGLADSVRQSLEELKTGAAGKELAEMATEVLEGRTSLREVAQSSAYSAQIGDGITAFKRWESDLTPEQRESFDQEQRRIASDDQGTDS